MHTRTRGSPEKGWGTALAAGVLVMLAAVVASTGGERAAADEGGDGSPWTVQDADTDTGFRDVAVVDGDTAWAVGTGGAIEHTDDGGETWTLQDSGVENEALMGVAFVDEETGWAVGASGTIVRTADGGASWDTQRSGNGTALMDVAFGDAETGWAVGAQGTVLHTENGGIDWDEQDTVATRVPTLHAVEFVDDETGWMAGPGMILHTDDAGAIWVEQDAPEGDALGGEMQDLAFVDDAYGWAVDESGTVLHTDDRGQTWRSQDAGGEAPMAGVGFGDRRTGLAVALRITTEDEPQALRTNDGGATWNDEDVPTEGSLYSMEFADAMRGWAVGDDATILRYDADGAPEGSQDWQQQDLAAEQNHTVTDLSFVDDETGWAVGRQGKKFQTADGGATWVPYETGYWLEAVDFVDAETGWAAGAEPILRTTDGGDSWEQLDSEGDRGWFDVAALDETTAWVVGLDDDDPAIMRTTDGGDQWASVAPDLGETAPKGVAFADAQTGWVVGQEGLILHTTDGGDDWEAQDADIDERLLDIAAIDGQTAWAVGDEGAILHTADGGESWEVQPSSTDETLVGVAFVDAGTGWAVGQEGVIRSTVDGGDVWYREDSGTNETLGGVSVVDADAAWASGDASTILTLSATAPPEPAEGSIAGTVSDADGDPVEDAEVVAADGEDEAATTTDDDGAYALHDLDEGTYELTVDADGFVPATEADVEVEAGETTTLDVTLNPEADPGEWPGSISGTVAREPSVSSCDPDSEPVPGVPVEVVSDSEDTVLRAVTDEDGHYEVASLPDGEYRVQVGGQRRYVDADTVVEVDAGSEATADLTLVGTGIVEGGAAHDRPDLSLDGVVATTPGVDCPAFGIAAIEVAARTADGDVVGPVITRQTQNGDFWFFDLPDDSYEVRARTRTFMDDGGSGLVDLDASEAGDTRSASDSNPTVTIDPDAEPGLWGAVKGTVVDANTGDPVEGALVQAPAAVSVAHGPDLSRSTDHDGAFAFDDLWAGDHDFAVSAPGYAQTDLPAESVAEGENLDLGDIELEPLGDGAGPAAIPEPLVDPDGGTIEGTLTDAQTDDAISGEDAQVWLWQGRHGERADDATTVDAYGQFSNDEFPSQAGHYRVHVHAAGYEPATAHVWVGHGDTVTVDLDLEPQDAEGDAGSIEGSVTDVFTDVGLDDAVVEATHQDPDATGGRTFAVALADDDASFELTDLAPGDWELTAAVADHRTAVQSVSVEGDQAKTVSVGLDRDDQMRAAGVVTDDDGAPISGAEVSAEQIELDGTGEVVEVLDTVDETTTADDGEFLLSDLDPDDRHRIVVDADGYDTTDRVMADRSVLFTLHPYTFELEPTTTPTPSPPEPGEGDVAGTVTDAEGAAVEGAAVIVADDDATEVAATETGSDGVYTLDDVDEGAYDLTATAEGFEPAAETGVEVEAGETTTVDLTLSAEPAVLGDVVSGDRVAGETRYDTAAELSEEVFDPGIAVAYVATGENSADALAGGVAAGVDAAPVLLATADDLPEATSDELDRLEPQRIAVLGGDSAIGANVEDELADHTDGTVDRLAGADRYETAAEISAGTFDDANTAYVATGLDFPDGLAGAPPAVQAPGPLLLTTDSDVPEVTRDELSRLDPDRIVMLGGTSVLDQTVKDALEVHGDVDRIAGGNRYETAADVADELDEPTGAFVATGEDYADALGAGAVAGTVNAPVLLTRSDELPEATGNALDALAPETIAVMGGEDAVSTDVAEAVQSYVAD